MRKDILNRKNEILKWISEGKTKKYICSELCCKQSTLNIYLDKLGIEYKGNQGGIDIVKHQRRDYMPLAEYLRSSTHIQSDKVRLKLLKEKYKEHKCECCQLTEWNGKPIPLELHHIDGNHYNNSLDNFQLLCPNCHAFTDSYRGRNAKATA